MYSTIPQKSCIKNMPYWQHSDYINIWTSFLKYDDYILLIKGPLLILDGNSFFDGSLNSLEKKHFELHVLLPHLPSMVQ
jgi:hypothetical protein